MPSRCCDDAAPCGLWTSSTTAACCQACSLQDGALPSVAVPIPRSGKDPTLASSYRPISLPSNISHCLEVAGHCLHHHSRTVCHQSSFSLPPPLLTLPRLPPFLSDSLSALQIITSHSPHSPHPHHSSSPHPPLTSLGHNIRLQWVSSHVSVMGNSGHQGSSSSSSSSSSGTHPSLPY